MTTETTTDPKPKKRSQLAKELAAMTKLAELLKPFDSEQRRKIFEAVQALFSDEPQV